MNRTLALAAAVVISSLTGLEASAGRSSGRLAIAYSRNVPHMRSHAPQNHHRNHHHNNYRHGNPWRGHQVVAPKVHVTVQPRVVIHRQPVVVQPVIQPQPVVSPAPAVTTPAPAAPAEAPASAAVEKTAEELALEALWGLGE